MTVQTRENVVMTTVVISFLGMVFYYCFDSNKENDFLIFFITIFFVTYFWKLKVLFNMQRDIHSIKIQTYHRKEDQDTVSKGCRC